jgi:hypothetical protein
MKLKMRRCRSCKEYTLKDMQMWGRTRVIISKYFLKTYKGNKEESSRKGNEKKQIH